MFNLQTPNEDFIEGVKGVAMTTELFSEEIERRIAAKEEETYIEAIAAFIEELDQEATDIKHLISSTLIGKIEAEAMKRGLLKEKHKTVDLMGMFS